MYAPGSHDSVQSPRDYEVRGWLTSSALSSPLKVDDKVDDKIYAVDDKFGWKKICQSG